VATDLADFKARLPVVEIVGRHVRLTRNGPIWKGLCPFHQEKTPSFTVTEARGTYHCFGCGAHGNALDFLMEIEGLGFAEAVRRAAELTGIEAPVTGRTDPAQKRAPGLVAVLEAANGHFRDALRGHEGRAAAAYVERRGIDAATTDRFELGFAPQARTRLTQTLLARGMALDDLVAAGLTIVPEDGGAPYDRFRGRLMFPIRDARGRLVGFGGRALEEGVAAKYLNSPEGPLFKKRELLYGADRLDRRAGRGTVHVVEGYMDVIALAQVGVPAVAPLGTATTPEQLARLWRLEAAPFICLDGDAAGQRAAGRLAERALEVLRAGCTLRFALLPAGEDPDSLVRSGGRAALETVTAAAVGLAPMLWRHLGGDRVDAAPEARAMVRRRLRELVRSIRDPDVRREYGREFQRLLEAGRRAAAAPRGVATASRLRAVEAANPYELLAPLLLSPPLLARFDDRIAALRFEDERFERLKEFLLDCAVTSDELTTAAVERLAGEADMAEALAALRRWKAWRLEAALSEGEREVQYARKLEAYERERAKAAERARSASAEGDGEDLDNLFRALDAVLNAPRPS
jgi:DNA primase